MLQNQKQRLCGSQCNFSVTYKRDEQEGIPCQEPFEANAIGFLTFM